MILVDYLFNKIYPIFKKYQQIFKSPNHKGHVGILIAVVGAISVSPDAFLTRLVRNNQGSRYPILQLCFGNI